MALAVPVGGFPLAAFRSIVVEERIALHTSGDPRFGDVYLVGDGATPRILVFTGRVNAARGFASELSGLIGVGLAFTGRERSLHFPLVLVGIALALGTHTSALPGMEERAALNTTAADPRFGDVYLSAVRHQKTAVRFADWTTDVARVRTMDEI